MEIGNIVSVHWRWSFSVGKRIFFLVRSSIYKYSTLNLLQNGAMIYQKVDKLHSVRLDKKRLMFQEELNKGEFSFNNEKCIINGLNTNSIQTKLDI